MTCDYCGKPTGVDNSDAHKLCYYRDVHRKAAAEVSALREENSRLSDALDAETEACAKIVDEACPYHDEANVIAGEHKFHRIAAVIRARKGR